MNFDLNSEELIDLNNSKNSIRSHDTMSNMIQCLSDDFKSNNSYEAFLELARNGDMDGIEILTKIEDFNFNYRGIFNF